MPVIVAVEFIKKAPDPPALEGKIAFIEVGKLLRALHPPDYFKGYMAPSHVQEEAWSLFMQYYQKALDAKAEIIVVDGQPRAPDQVVGICSLPIPRQFLYLHAPEGERRRRALAKCEMNKASIGEAAAAANLKLSLDRMERDILQYHDLLCDLHMRGEHITYVNTFHEEYTPKTLWDCVTALYSA